MIATLAMFFVLVTTEARQKMEIVHIYEWCEVHYGKPFQPIQYESCRQAVLNLIQYAYPMPWEEAKDGK